MCLENNGGEKSNRDISAVPTETKEPEWSLCHGAMAQQLGGQTALPEEPSSVPSNRR